MLWGSLRLHLVFSMMILRIEELTWTKIWLLLLLTGSSNSCLSRLGFEHFLLSFGPWAPTWGMPLNSPSPWVAMTCALESYLTLSTESNCLTMWRSWDFGVSLSYRHGFALTAFRHSVRSFGMSTSQRLLPPPHSDDLLHLLNIIVWVTWRNLSLVGLFLCFQCP